MQEQVRQHRRDSGPLRGPPLPAHHRAVGLHQRGGQPPLDVQHHPRLGRVRHHRLDDQVMIHGVKELGDIQVNDPVVPPTPLLARPDRIQRTPARPVPVGVRMEDRFHPGTHVAGDHGLCDPVPHRRHPEHPHPTILLRDMDRLDRWGEVTARTHPIPDPVQVVPQILLELLQTHPIGPGCALVRLDHLPRREHIPLRNHERLA